jgi:hypothetical protein
MPNTGILRVSRRVYNDVIQEAARNSCSLQQAVEKIWDDGLPGRVTYQKLRTELRRLEYRAPYPASALEQAIKNLNKRKK